MTTTEIREHALFGTVPDSHEGWIERAAQVAKILASDAVERDRANEQPKAEVQLLKDSGLVTLLGPREHGGGGANWITAYQVIREVAKGDGSIGQLLGYHYLWFWLPRLWGTPEQWQRLEAESTRNRWLWGGAVNPRDSDLVARDAGDHLVFSGFKTFSTGGRAADVTILEGVLEGSDDVHVFAVVPAFSEGMAYRGDWDNLGQRLTESGAIGIHDVRADWNNALGFVNKQFQGSVYPSLTLPSIQLVFVNFYTGIALGAVAAAAQYTRDKTRAWLYADVEEATEDPYILEIYGQWGADLAALEALVDRAGEAIQSVHDDPDGLTERRRGEIAVLVAKAKVKSTQISLDITSNLYQVLGARATASSYGFDRFWRNVRTHTLHDPVSYKLKEVGEFTLLDKIPEPTWYT
jgi:alkylation response protein AidB-like acyl-CoA dehydrogenase